jgi:predicted nucleic acid-binding protein
VKVLVDTSVWSLALRRKDPDQNPTTLELRELIREGRVVLLGAIRQELLSGVPSREQFRNLRGKLRPFPDFPLAADDHEYAAERFSQCRLRGIQGANTDFLMCSVAIRHGFPIFTTDRDFEHFAELLPLTLHRVRTH